MKILVTGGSGFIGSALLEKLTELDEIEIAALVNERPLRSDSPKINPMHGGLKYLCYKGLRRFEPDLIFHLARPTYPRFRMLGRKMAALEGRRVNHKLRECLKTHFPDTRLIYVSGSLMYGNSRPGASHTEDSPIHPVSFARDYAPLEQPILATLDDKQVNTLIVRVPWVLGDGSWFRWVYQAHYQKTGKLPVFGQGHNAMHFVLLKDLARWLIQLGLDPFVTGVRNLYSSTVLTQRDFVARMQRLLECEIDTHTEHYETAIREALSSNIVLSSNYPEVEALRSGDFDRCLTSLVLRLLENE